MEKKVLNVIAVFLLDWGLVALLVGCAPKKTAEVAPVAPSTKTDTTATMVQKCDEILKKSYGENIMTSVENGQYNIAIMEPHEQFQYRSQLFFLPGADYICELFSLVILLLIEKIVN